MRYDLAGMVRRARDTRRNQIALRPIVPTAAMAADLYARGYKPVIIAWQQALEQIGRTYERALPANDGLTTDSTFDLDSILSQVDGTLQRLVLALTPALRDWAVRAEGWQRGKWKGAVLTATGVDLGTLLSPSDVSDTIDAFVSRNVALIRSVTEQTQHRIGDIVLRGYQARTPIAQVGKEMREGLELSRQRALRIAADQSSKIAARLDQARQEQAGIDSYRWLHSRKRHPRLVHVHRDQKIFRWDQPPADGHPGTQPFCGCRARALLTF